MAPKQSPYNEFFKTFGEFKGMDFNAIFNVTRKNIEAAANVNQVISDSMQAITRRQVEIMKSNIEDMLNASKDIWATTSASPQDSAGKQADAAKHLIEKGLGYTREIVEMASKSGIEAMDVLNKRMVANMEDISTIVTKQAA
jgi:phasin family protein